MDEAGKEYEQSGIKCCLCVFKHPSSILAAPPGKCENDKQGG